MLSFLRFLFPAHHKQWVVYFRKRRETVVRAATIIEALREGAKLAPEGDAPTNIYELL